MTTHKKLPKKQANNGLSAKMPPHDESLEKAVLGALMLERDAVIEVVEILRPEVFYNDRHKEIYSAILDLFQKSEPIDLLMVSNKLRANGKLEFVGGPYALAQLTNFVSQSGNIVHHSRILLQHYMKRELLSISYKIESGSLDHTVDVFDLLDGTENALFGISEMIIRKNYQPVRSLMLEAVNQLVALKDVKDGLTGVPSGFIALDRVTSGWQKSDLVIIAARPGMGKTAFVLSALRNATVDFKKPVAIFSLEMSGVQLVNRLISSEAEIESEKIKTGRLSSIEWEQIMTKSASLSDSPIFVDDTPGLSILELRAKCRRLKHQHDIQLVIVDYLQLMNTGEKKTSTNREQEISFISRSLKQLAKELNVPVIALSQLSRAVESRGGDKRPMLSDLRESGAIEQDADMVIFLYRPEYYGITEDEDGKPVAGMGEVIIAKHRNGSLQTVPLRFIGKFTRFTDWEPNNTGYLFEDEAAHPRKAVMAISSNHGAGPGSVSLPMGTGETDYPF